jgi:hypothetical protein
MPQHFLEAYLNKTSGPGFRIVCLDPPSCRRREGNDIGCIYKKQFIRTGTLDMVRWPEGLDHVLGVIELTNVILEPPSLTSLPPVIVQEPPPVTEELEVISEVPTQTE